MLKGRQMETTNLFAECFSKEVLKELFFKKIWYERAVGLDKMTVSSFAKNLDSELEVIRRKITGGSYHFTTYRQMLLLKGAKKYPREISVATVRDRLVLTALNRFLVLRLGAQACQTPLPQNVIKESIKAMESGRFDYYLKFDIEHFYSSIHHEKLFSILQSTVGQQQVVSLLIKAVETPARNMEKTGSAKGKKQVGVPEGIPVSNVLANIYLQAVDCYWKNDDSVCYHRYVDDILIFCKRKDAARIKQCISGQMDELKLHFNDKTESGELDKPFTYLGYAFDKAKVSVRKSSVLHLEESLEKTISKAQKDDCGNLPSLPLWKLNLRITGFIIEGKRYGWLFYFSQINDLQLLYHLDWVVHRLLARMGYKNDKRVKRFHRAYFEIQYKLHTTTYIPDFDTYTLEDKKQLLTSLGIHFMPEETEQKFHRLIVNAAAELEKDVQSFS